VGTLVLPVLSLPAVSSGLRVQASWQSACQPSRPPARLPASQPMHEAHFCHCHPYCNDVQLSSLARRAGFTAYEATAFGNISGLIPAVSATGKWAGLLLQGGSWAAVAKGEGTCCLLKQPGSTLGQLLASQQPGKLLCESLACIRMFGAQQAQEHAGAWLEKLRITNGPTTLLPSSVDGSTHTPFPPAIPPALWSHSLPCMAHP